MGKTRRYTSPDFEPFANKEAFRADIERRRSNAGTPRPGKKGNKPPRSPKHRGRKWEDD